MPDAGEPAEPVVEDPQATGMSCALGIRRSYPHEVSFPSIEDCEMVMSSQEELDGVPLGDLESRLSNLLADVSLLFDCSLMHAVLGGLMYFVVDWQQHPRPILGHSRPPRSLRKRHLPTVQLQLLQQVLSRDVRVNCFVLHVYQSISEHPFL